MLFFPYGKPPGTTMRVKIQSPIELAEVIRTQRKALRLTQEDLAGAANLGPRFIGDLERGKPTCEIGKTLQVLAMLGIELELMSKADMTDE